MVQTSSRRWIEKMKKFTAGERDNLLCPVNEDSYLKWEWISAPGTGGSQPRGGRRGTHLDLNRRLIAEHAD
jgi:hypothetical protein